MSLLADPQPLTLPCPVVLFDLDGTLTDSATGVINGFLHAAQIVGFEAPAGPLEWLLGPPMIDTLQALGLGDRDVERALAAYRDYYSTTGWAENALFDGIGDLVSTVRATGSRLAIATSKNEGSARRIAAHFGIADRFEFIGGASDDRTRRAKSDVVAHSLRALGVDPVEATDGGTADVVMIGDRDHDVHGAGRWGVPTVFVEWGYGADGEGTDAARTVGSVDELCRLLTGRR